MTTKNIQDVVAEKFLKELCWQDTDGKWFLNGTPDTVPKILQFLTQLVKEVEAGERERILSKLEENFERFAADERTNSFWLSGYAVAKFDAEKALTPPTSDEEK